MRGEEGSCLCISGEGTGFLFVLFLLLFFHLVLVVTQSFHGQFQVPTMVIDKMFLLVFDVCKSSIGTPPHCSVDRATVWANVGYQPPQNSRHLPVMALYSTVVSYLHFTGRELSKATTLGLS